MQDAWSFCEAFLLTVSVSRNSDNDKLHPHFSFDDYALPQAGPLKSLRRVVLLTLCRLYFGKLGHLARNIRSVMEALAMNRGFAQIRSMTPLLARLPFMGLPVRSIALHLICCHRRGSFRMSPSLVSPAPKDSDPVAT